MYRKPSREVDLYQKSATDCCPETTDKDVIDDVTDRQYAGYKSRTSCTDCDVTPYVTPAVQPSSDVNIVRCSERIVRCSVCATIITSRSDGDVTAADDQSRRCVPSSPVDDGVNIPAGPD